MFRKSEKRNGFTIVEMIIVISLITILTGFVVTAVFNARKESRDMSRQTDLEQYKLAVKLYKEAYGSYPAASAGVPLGVGASYTDSEDEVHNIDDDLALFLTEVKSDPLSGGSADSDYNYWYFSGVSCGSGGRVVVTAQTVENDKYINAEEVCGESSELEHDLVLPVN